MPGDLAENEERLRMALEGAGLAIWDWNIVSGEQIVSPKWFGMLGYCPDEVGGDFESWQRLVHPDDLPGVLTVIDDHLHDRLPFYEVEYRLKTRDGGWKWVRARGRVVERGPAGQPLRMAGTHRDISARKEMEARLQAQEDRQKSILASMREAVWSFTPDFGKLQYVNAAVEAIYGRPMQDFYDQSDLWRHVIHPDDQPVSRRTPARSWPRMTGMSCPTVFCFPMGRYAGYAAAHAWYEMNLANRCAWTASLWILPNANRWMRLSPAATPS